MPLNPTVIWLLAGSILCLMELLLPTAFAAFMMGLSAFLVALVSLILPQTGLQVVLWMAFSAVLIFLSRRFLPRSKPSTLEDATEAETLTEILPGQTGRVIYEGNSWQARCEDHKLAIAPKQKVYVVGRKGTTLIVVPESLLHS